MTESGKTVFISYSHRDKPWLDRLLTHLKPRFLERGGIRYWSDVDIEPGDPWHEKIEEALENACAAVLLISPDFLASDFIGAQEMPVLLAAAKRRGIPILSLHVSHSAYEQTAIAHYQGLNDPARPLKSLTEDEVDKSLVRASHEIHTQSTRRPARREESRTAVSIVTRFATGISKPALYRVDDRGRLWVGDRLQVKIFKVDQPASPQRWVVPQRPWKTRAEAPWRDALVVADWDGSLFALRAEDASLRQPLHAARHDDLPVHRLSVTPDGRLIAAAWNGDILAWNADGRRTEGRAMHTSALPERLTALPDAGLAVLDQAGCLTRFGPEGTERWRWQSRSKILDVWAVMDDGEVHLLALSAQREVLRIDGPGRVETRRLERDARFAAYRMSVAKNDKWAAVVQDGGRVDWICAEPFEIIAGVDAGVDIVDLRVVGDPAGDSAMIAVGLCRDGRLVLVRDDTMTILDDPVGVSRLEIDLSGRFLFLLEGSTVLVCRNPVLDIPMYTVELSSVEGVLEVGPGRTIRVHLRNMEAFPLRVVGAILESQGMIKGARCSRIPREAISSGEMVELMFVVEALVPGELPVTMKVEIEDEGGPPTVVSEVSMHLTSSAPGVARTH